MIKKLSAFSLIILQCSLLYTQEIDLDKAYLESLPEGVKEDVLDRIEAKEEIEKPVYRRASTMVDKDPIEEEEDDDSYYENKIEIFGKKFFDTMQSSFMPINEPNFDDSYVLDFGDTLEIQLIGQNDLNDKFVLRRDGTINLEDIGKITLSGLSLKEATKLIKAKVNDSYIGTEAYVTLSEIRDVQIIISGNAFNPGIYTLNGNSNILHAITMAGGINDEGSYRDIKLIRDDEVIEVLDLYELFVFGKTNLYKRLRSGDSILVGPTLDLVNVLSGVNRPAYYEIKDKETFEDLIKFANGLTSEADLDYIQLQRFNKKDLIIDSFQIDELYKQKPRNNDTLIIGEYKYSSVEIIGAVKTPGVYTISNGDTLKDVIQRAGGYEDYAYPFGGFLNNVKTLEINKVARERLYEQFLRNLIDSLSSNMNASPPTNSLPLILKELRDAKDVGRIIAEFDLDILSTKPELNTTLEDGDEIIIPNLTQQVYVYGEVNNQGAIRYVSGKNLKHYINGSGGLMSSADKKLIYVIHPNGETSKLMNDNRILSILNNDNRNQSIYPGSIIYVPRSLGMNTVQTAAILSPIISGLALSLASLSALDN